MNQCVFYGWIGFIGGIILGGFFALAPETWQNSGTNFVAGAVLALWVVITGWLACHQWILETGTRRKISKISVEIQKFSFWRSTPLRCNFKQRWYSTETKFARSSHRWQAQAFTSALCLGNTRAGWDSCIRQCGMNIAASWPAPFRPQPPAEFAEVFKTVSIE
jgi:hypothetical protein